MACRMACSWIWRLIRGIKLRLLAFCACGDGDGGWGLEWLGVDGVAWVCGGEVGGLVMGMAPLSWCGPFLGCLRPRVAGNRRSWVWVGGWLEAGLGGLLALRRLSTCESSRPVVVGSSCAGSIHLRTRPLLLGRNNLDKFPQPKTDHTTHPATPRDLKDNSDVVYAYLVIQRTKITQSHPQSPHS